MSRLCEDLQSRAISAWLRAALAAISACCITVLSTAASAATTFGIYDARTLAMGGASVASANNDNAQFYNSALLAFNDLIEERTQDSRFLFPIIVPQFSESAITVEDISGGDFSTTLSRAITNFNAMANEVSAQTVANAAANLNAALGDIDNEDLFADLYFGLGVSEPSRFQGAGFFLGSRLIAGGGTSVSATDRALLDAYREGLSFIATGGAQGVAHPELFDANGALIDPDDNFDSTASAAGAAITEIGVAMSRQLTLFGQPVAAGISFKVLSVDTFEDTQDIVGNRIDIDENSEVNVRLNFDFGLVKTFGDKWRVALAVKDVIPHNYRTSLGTTIRLRPRSRLGLAYQAGPLQIAIDADLLRNEPLSVERATQEMAIGAEWAFGRPLKIRAGYRQDLLGFQDGVASVGVGTVWKRLAIDAAYAQGDGARAAALQFGIVF